MFPRMRLQCHPPRAESQCAGATADFLAKEMRPFLRRLGEEPPDHFNERTLTFRLQGGEFFLSLYAIFHRAFFRDIQYGLAPRPARRTLAAWDVLQVGH